MLSTTGTRPPGAIAERYPASCIATQPGCTEPLAEVDLGEAAGHEYTDNTRGLAFLGRWSNGKTVLLDNRLNNIDYGLPRDELHQRMLALYGERVQSVRAGSRPRQRRVAAPPSAPRSTRR